MPRTIVADLDQYLESGELPATLSAPALKLARHLASIVAWVTSHPSTMLRKKLEALLDRLALVQSASNDSNWRQRGN